jgi:hypothetical protein
MKTLFVAVSLLRRIFHLVKRLCKQSMKNPFVVAWLVQFVFFELLLMDIYLFTCNYPNVSKVEILNVERASTCCCYCRPTIDRCIFLQAIRNTTQSHTILFGYLYEKKFCQNTSEVKPGCVDICWRFNGWREGMDRRRVCSH